MHFLKGWLVQHEGCLAMKVSIQVENVSRRLEVPYTAFAEFFVALSGALAATELA